MAITPPYVPILTKQINQQKGGEVASRGKHYDHQERVVPLEVDYLERTAKDRGISRTKLVRVVMEKVVRDNLFLNL